MTYIRALTALADPTRRKIFERIRSQPRTVGELARYARVSQPGASQHLAVLRRAGLVTHVQMGTRRFYRADSTGLAELRRYVETLWDDVLTAFAAADPSPPSGA